MPGDCTLLGTGSYSIATLGDARVLTLDNVPGEASWLGYERVFVEREGAVYYGFRSKPSSNAYVPRLNGVAGNALLERFGMPTLQLP